MKNRGYNIHRQEYEQLCRMHAEKRRMQTSTRNADGTLRSHNPERAAWNTKGFAVAMNKGRGYAYT
jgi:hypothetical protein